MYINVIFKRDIYERESYNYLMFAEFGGALVSGNLT